MAEGALAHSHADIAVSVTGITGPGGGSDAKPVGLVHLAVARKGRPTLHRECRFGDIGRGEVRMRSVEVALTLLQMAGSLRLSCTYRRLQTSSPRRREPS